MANASASDSKLPVDQVRCLFCYDTHLAPFVNPEALEDVLRQDNWQCVAHFYCIYMQFKPNKGSVWLRKRLSKFFDSEIVSVVIDAYLGPRTEDDEFKGKIDAYCDKIQDGKVDLFWDYKWKLSERRKKPPRRQLTLLLWAAAFSNHPRLFECLVKYIDIPVFPEAYGNTGKHIYRGSSFHAILACSGFNPRQSDPDRCRLVQQRMNMLVSEQRSHECNWNGVDHAEAMMHLVREYGRLHPGNAHDAADEPAVAVIKMRREMKIERYASPIHDFLLLDAIIEDSRVLDTMMEYIRELGPTDREVRRFADVAVVDVGIFAESGDPKFSNLPAEKRRMYKSRIRTRLAVMSFVGLNSICQDRHLLGKTIADAVWEELHQHDVVELEKWERWWLSKTTVDRAAPLLHRSETNADGTQSQTLNRDQAEIGLMRKIADFMGPS